VDGVEFQMFSQKAHEHGLPRSFVGEIAAMRLRFDPGYSRVFMQSARH
jgi:hypothetical protein